MLKRFNPFFFATKVWLTSVSLTPLFFFFANPMTEKFGSFKAFSEDIFLVYIFGGALSVPNWILLSLVAWLLIKKGKDVDQIKKLLTIISMILTFCLFFIVIILVEFPIKWWTSLCYTSTILLGIRFYHLENNTSLIDGVEDILDDNIF